MTRVLQVQGEAAPAPAAQAGPQQQVLQPPGARAPGTVQYSTVQYTAGDEGAIGDLSCISIFSHVQGLLPRRQLAATRWSAQIPVRAHCFGCISQIKFCWKLPHFRSPDIFYFISKLKIVGPLLNNI